LPLSSPARPALVSPNVASTSLITPPRLTRSLSEEEGSAPPSPQTKQSSLNRYSSDASDSSVFYHKL
jgi:hypothetical protein